MNIPPRHLSALVVLLCAVIGARAGDRPPAVPDLILHNGHVFTGDPAQPHAQAIAIRDGRVAAIGDDEAIAASAGRGTQRIDLHGRRVVPGINDALIHLAGGRGRAPTSRPMQMHRGIVATMSSPGTTACTDANDADDRSTIRPRCASG